MIVFKDRNTILTLPVSGSDDGSDEGSDVGSLVGCLLLPFGAKMTKNRLVF